AVSTVRHSAESVLSAKDLLMVLLLLSELISRPPCRKNISRNKHIRSEEVSLAGCKDFVKDVTSRALFVLYEESCRNKWALFQSVDSGLAL
ncbi:hypothetical protein, partial [Franconibacter pulveris]|uniref:hypothetical protein n=1 Tax=Franconibacter pulveris TaxID=435910 RepID=UPI001F46CF97